MENSPELQVLRVMVHENCPQGLLEGCVSILRPARLVHWDGLRSVAVAAAGKVLCSDDPPPCLGGSGSCVSCRLTGARDPIFPLRAGDICLGALLLGPGHEFGDSAVIVRITRDLTIALARLSKLESLTRRDQMRRDIEAIGQLGGWELDPFTGQADWTEGVARIHGLADDAAAPGMVGGLEFYEPESRLLLEQAVNRAIQHGEGYDLEVRLTTTEGGHKWVRTRGVPVFESGRLVRLRGLLQDISQRKAIEGALLASHRRADAIFERAGVGLAECHAQSQRFVRVNPKLCEILGFSLAEMLQLSWPDVVHPEDCRRSEDCSRGCDQVAGSASFFEKRCLRKNGDYIWVQVTRSPQIESEYFVLAVDDVNQRHLALQALSDQKRRLTTIFELLLAGIAIIRVADGRILDVNPALERLLGWSADEMRGSTVQTLGLFAKNEDLQRLKSIFDLGQSIPIECEVCRKSGEVAYFLLTAGPALIDDEECLVCAWHDMTELRRSDAALREIDHRSRIVFEMAPAGICQIDPKSGRILDANQRFCAITGYELEELLTRTILALGLPDDYQECARTYRSIARGQVVEQAMEQRYLRKDQSIVWVQAHVTLLRDQSGSATRAIAVVEDVTAKRAAEQRLLEAEQRSRIALDAAGQGTMKVDLQQFSVELDARAQGHFGVEKSVIDLRALQGQIHQDDRGLAKSMAEKASQAAPFSFQLRIYRGTDIRWLAFHGLSLPGDQGEPRTFIATTQDITEAKALEEALRSSQKMEAIGRLAGGIAHDFNNLLTVILSYTILSIDQLGDKVAVRADLEEVVAAADRAKELTRQLLAFSRRQVMTLESIDLNTLILSLKRMLVRLLGENITIQVRLDPSAKPVRADRGQLEQVLLNLAVNARDAMPRGGRLSLCTDLCELEEAPANALNVLPGCYVLLTITDTGTGMPDEVRARIFEPFFTTKRQGEGTGLGLAMVYGIVRQTQGAIDCRSAPGQGTCFRIFIPISPVAVGQSTPPVVTVVPGGDETLLVVEDEPAILKLAARTLEDSGYRVLSAANGVEALRISREQGQEIDLVLSDVVMPDMSGPELFVHLRPLCPNSQFLLMSGYPKDALAGQGVAQYLSKPFESNTLKQAVRHLLDQPVECPEAGSA